MQPRTWKLMGKNVCWMPLVILVLTLSLGVLIFFRETKSFERVTVVVAKKRILSYTPVRDPSQMFELKELPFLSAPAKFFTDLKQLEEGGTIVVPMEKGTPLLPYMYKDSHTTGIGGIGPALQSVGLTGYVDVPHGGCVDDETYVDVIHSVFQKDGKERVYLVLEDVLVREVNRLPFPPGDNAGHVRAEMDISVSPKQLQTLLRAIEEGGKFIVVLNPNGRRILSGLLINRPLELPEGKSPQ